jgi:RNA polymerase sigma factor (sigma-70 family)
VAVKEPSNDQWLVALRGPTRDEALAELRVVLMRGLRAALGGQANRVESSVEDFVQEALIKILDNLDSFRGECRFTTWAQKICVRTAFAEMRRSRWRDVSLDEVISQPEGNTAADPQLDPERAATQTMIMEKFRRFIDEELTDRQRTALLAALGGMNTADRIGSSKEGIMTDNSVNVIDGSTFLISDRHGDARAENDSRKTDGLFYRDMRHLSTFALAVKGLSLEFLSTDNTDFYGASFFFALSTGLMQRVYRRPVASLMRRRSLLRMLREEITLQNHTDTEIRIELEFRFAADFADLFEVKDDRIVKAGHLKRACERDSILFSYTRDGFERGTEIEIRVPVKTLASTQLRLECPAESHEPVKATVTLDLPAKSEWTLALDVFPYEGDEELEEYHRQHGLSQARNWLQEDLRRWIEESPLLFSSSDPLSHSWKKSIEDLASLRCTDEGAKDEEIIAAGLPWFMALFGRDSLISGYQSVMIKPGLSKGILRALAHRQAKEVDDFTDAQPGKIPHELRHGELAHFGKSPHRPYYGSVDATPLFLILLHESWRWTADDELVRELEGPAREALRWISEYGDSDGDGYVDYARRSIVGLENQGWKDSFNSVLFSDGSLAEPPIALCEVQGYVYDAWLRSADLARRVWGDEDLAHKLRLRAEELKRRFNEDFWMEGRSYYALALDGSGRKVDSVTSNAGHLLWSGIVPEERAATLVRRMMNPNALFSGWGIRTMSKEDAGYNPIEYHNGTVWPHDNSLIAHGLYRYGFQTEAARIASALLDAAPYFDFRLPEVFAGYDRSETDFPVQYPTASSPQAWASGSIPLLVRTTLGVRPNPAKRELESAPLLPREFSDLRVKGVPAFGKRFDVPT